MPRFSSIDMVHNHYLDEAKNKTQERYINSKTSVMPSVRLQNTTNGSKPKPRSTNQMTRKWPTSKSSCVTITTVPVAEHSRNSGSFPDFKHFVCSTCQKCVFNANYDACVTKILKEVNSRAKIQPHKIRNSNKLVEQKSHIQKPVDYEPSHGSNVDISKIHKCKQTLDLSAGTSINVQKEQSINLSAEVPTVDMIIMTSRIELERLFGPLFDEYFNGENQVVSKSSAVTTVDASDKRQQQSHSTSSTSTPGLIVTADGNFDL
ncbi:hypothetical protein Tco_1028078 [Tanacetum coccineum]